MVQKNTWVYFSATLAAVIWAFSFIWYKEVLKVYNPVSLVLIRLAISSILLFGITLLMRKLSRIQKKDIPTFLILSFFSPFLYFLGESHGVNRMSASLAAVIVSTIPLFSPLAAYFTLKERISTMNFLGILVSVLGVSFVIFHKGLYLDDVQPIGVVLMFVAVVAAIGHSILVKKLSVRYNAISIVTYQNSIGVLFFLPLFLAFDYRHFIGATPAASTVLALVCLGVFASSLAFILFTYAIKNIGVSKTNVFANAIPVITAFLAFFILGEDITYVKMAGTLIVVSGLFLAQHKVGTK